MNSVGGADRDDSALTRSWLSLVQRLAGLPFVARAPRDAAAELVSAAAAADRVVGEHVHLANAYSIAVAEDPSIREVFTHGRGWLLPDGRPLSWFSWLRGDAPRLRQVRGPQLMLDVVDVGREAGLRHYLLGGEPAVLRELQEQLELGFPGTRIVGGDSPPFRAPTEQELAERDAAILASGAQIVWVGLGTPKQDFEAMRLAASLPVVAVAVGAAFDYAAGRRSPAPRWISAVGFEWLWRFAAEPRRLWRRYTIGSATFLRAVLREEVTDRRRRGLVAATRRSITVVGQLPPPLHGSAVMTGRLVDALTAGGEDVIVVDRRFSRSVAEVGRFGLRKLVAVPSLLARMVTAMRRSRRVVMLITNSPGSFLVDVLLLALVRGPVTHYIHTNGFSALAARGRILRTLVRWSLRRADRVVVLGPSLVPDIEPFVEAERIEIIANCTPAAESVETAAHEPGARLLFLSNLIPGKGADVFVRLAARLWAGRPDLPWRFDLAGAGDAAALGQLPEALTLHGRVEGEAKERLLHDADLLVVPSTYAAEAQPLVIVEALAHGLPVVAYDTGGIADLVDSSVGRLVTAGDEQALESAVLGLIEDPGVLHMARAAALDRYRTAHSLEVFEKAWTDLVSASDLPGTRPAASPTVPPATQRPAGTSPDADQAPSNPVVQ